MSVMVSVAPLLARRMQSWSIWTRRKPARERVGGELADVQCWRQQTKVRWGCRENALLLLLLVMIVDASLLRAAHRWKPRLLERQSALEVR